ncbi:MAG TPA: acetylxylan esterase [Candidatus Paceibacterota bacterium]|nr:acetylxylan esterase [Verrucomicrobiota bacterium]HSA09453.1 acetylxylan esterase [Candidatus Paceibacterota bacterium]
MKLLFCPAVILLVAFTLPAAVSTPPSVADRASRNDQALSDYFHAETAALAQRCLADIRSLKDWEARRGEYRRQLAEMLGLWPALERTDLNPVITGKLEQADFTVEKLHFQALPKLYVTANLYLPKKLDAPAPGILYACGHSRSFTNGASCGNKTGYQHHGAWFARNGYVCLLIDTVQLGEIQGCHRGTYSDGRWWWNSRGYTPAGIEAWFGIRALDYLCSRPEVDKERLGMTGRSGGGAYTWTVAALDDRVKVAAPIAGITDLRNQVVDGCVEGHCDCMFHVNTYRWDLPQVAALIAPRPLLIGNSDKDKIFPLDGVVRVHQQTRRIYDLYNQPNHLGLLITEGPHEDTQDLQVPVFRWFNRFLKGQDPLIEMAATKCFTPDQLRVFDKLPADEVNTRVDEIFVPKAAPLRPAASKAQAGQQRADYVEALRGKVFGGWPAERSAINPQLEDLSGSGGLRVRACRLNIQTGVSPWLWTLQDPKVKRPEKVLLTVLDAEGWTNSPARWLWLGGGTPEAQASLRREMQAGKLALAFFAPREVEPARWQAEKKRANQVRRRYMLLGQTLDGMRVWDIQCAARALKALPEFKQTPLCLRANKQMGVNAAYAALFEPGIEKLELKELPASQNEGPDYLNVLKVGDLPQVLELLGKRADAGHP